MRPSPSFTGFSARFGDEHAGWMQLEVRAGRETFSETFSHVPYASLPELVWWALGLLEGAPTRRVRWSAEPEEYEFDAVPMEGATVRFEVIRYRNSQRSAATPGDVVFAVETTRRAVCQAFWRALRDLQSREADSEFTRRWGELPAREIDALARRLRETAAP